MFLTRKICIPFKKCYLKLQYTLLHGGFHTHTCSTQACRRPHTSRYNASAIKMSPSRQSPCLTPRRRLHAYMLTSRNRWSAHWHQDLQPFYQLSSTHKPPANRKRNNPICTQVYGSNPALSYVKNCRHIATFIHHKTIQTTYVYTHGHDNNTKSKLNFATHAHILHKITPKPNLGLHAMAPQ
jgi:hypothetical protein